MRNAEQILTNAIRHIRRTHMNTRSWTLTAADEQAIAILNDSRFWAGRFQPEFDRINHGPFEHPVSDTCAECGKSAIHEFYGSDGNLQKGELFATNSSHSWTKRLCNQCWTAFQNRAFVTIERKADTFTATCAF